MKPKKKARRKRAKWLRMSPAEAGVASAQKVFKAFLAKADPMSVAG